MAQLPIEIPPPGFEQLSEDEQREYVRQLAALVDEAAASERPLSPELIDEVRRRRERHRAHPEEAVPWEVVRERLLAKWG